MTCNIIFGSNACQCETMKYYDASEAICVLRGRESRLP